MRSIRWIHAGYILNVPHFSDVIVLCPKCGRSIKLGTLRSHDWVHSKSNQHFSQEQIKTTFMGTFSINPTFAHWAHWSHLLSVLPMYPVCAWWIFGSLSPVSMTLNVLNPRVAFTSPSRLDLVATPLPTSQFRAPSASTSSSILVLVTTLPLFSSSSRVV